MTKEDIISEADGSEVYALFDKVEEIFYKIYDFIVENPQILVYLMIIVVIKSICTAIYGLYKSRRGKTITEVYDVLGEKTTYSKQYVSFVRPIIEIIILVIFIKMVYF